MMPNRRQMMKGAAAFAAASTLPAHATFAAKQLDKGVFEMRARAAVASITGEGGPQTPVWAYNDTVPGPVLRVQRGQTVRVRFINELDQPTSIHWHGIRIDNAMDGVSGLTQAAVEPGDTFDYEFSVPDAGTYWYHAHNRSWEQVARGLYGALIVDENEQAFPAERDLTLMVDDWRLQRDGTLEAQSLGNVSEWAHGGRLGNWVTVNGTPRPEFELTAGEPHRVRVINACNARVLEIDPNSIGARVLAEDGQPFAEPLKLGYTPYLLGPAQRVDLLLQPREEGSLAFQEISDRPFTFAQFNVVGSRDTDRAAAVPALPANNLPVPDLANAQTFVLLMEGGAMGSMRGAIVDGVYRDGRDLAERKQAWSFNGVAGLDAKPFFSVAKGQPVIVKIINDTSWLHAMHVHGHHFQVLERNGQPDRNKPWRDTFLIGANGTTKIAFVADNPGKWLLHCHMLEHQAAGMKTWFEVGV